MGLSQSAEQKRGIINICWILYLKSSKKRRENQLSSSWNEMMKIFVFYSWIKIIGLFSLLWSAKTYHKVCDTNISILVSINQHSMFLIVVPLQLHLTEIWWLLRYFKTSFSCRVWNKSTPTPRKSSYFDQILQLKVEFWKRSFCSESSYTVKIVWIHYAVEQYALKLKTVWWKCLIQGLKLHCP